MNIVLVLAIIFGGTILALVIIGSTILIGINILKGGTSRRRQILESEEAKMIQSIYKGLSEMEKRIETIETIILDQGRKEKMQ
jgi:phage shock protein B